MGRAVRADEHLGRDWQTRLRSRGYRLTSQRRLVLEAVGELGHATPEEISAAVRQRSAATSISTVYRTLELLEGLGLVEHTHLGHGAPTYFVATDADHVHLVCRDCGQVQEADVELLGNAVRRLADERGFALDVGHVALFGRCAGCG